MVAKDFYGMTSVSGSLVKDCGMTSASGRALEARGYSNVESRVAARRFRVNFAKLVLGITHSQPWLWEDAGLC